MSAPLPITAQSLNAIIQYADLLNDYQDAAMANAEMALGAPLETRALDLCIGFAPAGPLLIANALQDITVGPGLARRGGALLSGVMTETGLAVRSLLGSYSLANCYAFGSVFLSSDNPNVSVAPYTQVVMAGPSSYPFLISNNIDMDTAKTMFEMDRIPMPVAPTSPSGVVTMEIFRFVVNIVFFDPSNPQNDLVTIEAIDLRKMRGFGGFADEAMAVALVPAAISDQRNSAKYVQLINKEISNIVKAWVFTSSWNPNFIQYWQAHLDLMPARLRSYLFTEFGVSL